MEQFTAQDLDFLRQRGSDSQQVEKQFSYFFKGFPYAHLNRIATIDDGIVKLDDSQIAFYNQYYDTQTASKKIVKFVPASGAASRMFKDLFDFLNQPDPIPNDKINTLILKLKEFAFYPDLIKLFPNFENLLYVDPKEIVSSILLESGLNYGNLPKGLLRFHKYQDGNRTAIEEHFVEAALYANCKGLCNIHFTVSPSHIAGFQSLIAEIMEKYETRFDVKYNISYSIQEPATDTLAAELNNTPFRDKEGNLLFRPGGHGALIQNLNAIDADLVFIKNIDNVITEDKVQPTVDYKKACGGLLLWLQSQSFKYQELLENPNITYQQYNEIVDFTQQELKIQFISNKPSIEEIKHILNRPIRICGMVKNEGEPGGGPFWVKNLQNITSCQIVESSQIELSNPHQKAIMSQSTHFNPVDMVCGFKNYKGELFQLADFVDDQTGFISEKSYEGRTLKAMELPGLWNGAMANWITIFVEVPLITFNPVKTIFDLLRR